MKDCDSEEIALLSKEDAIAEVRHWLEVEKVDPDRIFSAMGDQVIRYRDLVAHLENETPDGHLLRFAISRGRMMKGERSRSLAQLLHIAPSSAATNTEPAPDAMPPDGTEASA